MIWEGEEDSDKEGNTKRMSRHRFTGRQGDYNTSPRPFPIKAASWCCHMVAAILGNLERSSSSMFANRDEAV